LQHLDHIDLPRTKDAIERLGMPGSIDDFSNLHRQENIRRCQSPIGVTLAFFCVKRKKELVFTKNCIHLPPIKKVP
jgi:hypothetical protein